MPDHHLKNDIYDHFFNNRVSHEVSLLELVYVCKHKWLATPEQTKAAMDALVLEGRFTTRLETSGSLVYLAQNPVRLYTLVYPKIKEGSPDGEE